MTEPRKPVRTFACWLCMDSGLLTSYTRAIGTGGLCDCAAGRAMAEERRGEREREAGR